MAARLRGDREALSSSSELFARVWKRREEGVSRRSTVTDETGKRYRVTITIRAV